MTWEIVLGMIALAGVTVTLGGVLWRLAATLTRLELTLAALQRLIDADKLSNSKSHERIFSRLEDHETRIHDLEVK